MDIPTCLSTASGIVAAEVTINGLALCCFNQINQNNKFWEVAYIRHKKHALTLNIDRVDLRDGSVTNLENISVPSPLPSFDISLDSGTNAVFDGFSNGGCQTGNFVRAGLGSAGNGPNDLRWMIDVAGTEPRHGNVVRLKPPGNGRVDVTLLRLHHSLLFTTQPSALPVKFVPRCSSDPTVEGFELGQSNETIGGLMLAPTPGRILVSGLTITDPLVFNEQTRYRIDIINRDLFNAEHWPNLSKGDFHLFYEILDVSGEQKELWAVVEHDHFFNAPDGDCNPSFISSMGTLQPLIQ